MSLLEKEVGSAAKINSVNNLENHATSTPGNSAPSNPPLFQLLLDIKMNNYRSHYRIICLRS